MARDHHSSAYEDSDRRVVVAAHRTLDHAEVVGKGRQVVDMAMGDNRRPVPVEVQRASECPRYLVSLIGPLLLACRACPET